MLLFYAQLCVHSVCATACPCKDFDCFLDGDVWVSIAMASDGFSWINLYVRVCVWVRLLYLSSVAALQFMTFWQQLLQLNPKVALLSNRTAFSLTNAQFVDCAEYSDILNIYTGVERV